MNKKRSNQNTAKFNDALAAYEKLVNLVVSVLRAPKSPTHFSDLRQMIDELEVLDMDITSSSIMRENIDVPDK